MENRRKRPEYVLDGAPESTPIMIASTHVVWAQPDEDAGALARFFVANVDSTYVSHGEVFVGRATPSGAWVTNIEEIVQSEVSGILAGNGPSKSIAVARSDDLLLGICIVSFETPGIAVIEDLVVLREQRGRGVGAQMLRAVVTLAKERRVFAVYIESGRHNVEAHRFFEQQGFAPVSVVMRMELDLPEG